MIIIKGKVIKGEGEFKIDGTFKDCTFLSFVPKQMCFECKTMFESYLVDHEIWNKLPKALKDKYICSDCLKKHVVEDR